MLQLPLWRRSEGRDEAKLQEEMGQEVAMDVDHSHVGVVLKSPAQRKL